MFNNYRLMHDIGYNVIYVCFVYTFVLLYGRYDTSSIAYRGFIISHAGLIIFYRQRNNILSAGGRFFASTPSPVASAIYLVFFALIPPTCFIAHYRGNKLHYKTTKPQVDRGMGAY